MNYSWKDYRYVDGAFTCNYKLFGNYGEEYSTNYCDSILTEARYSYNEYGR